MVLEVFAPGAIFIWIGIAAAIVGTILLVAPDLGWEVQLLIFSVIPVASIVVWQSYKKRNPTETDRRPGDAAAQEDEPARRAGSAVVGVHPDDSPLPNESDTPFGNHGFRVRVFGQRERVAAGRE